MIDAIDDLGVLDDTLIYYIIGDNGASAEGTLNGCFNEMTTLNGMPGIETTEFLLSKIDDFGTPRRLQPLRRRLGARTVHAVSVDQAGRLALGRHPQRHHRALAERDHGQGRDAQPVPPRDRRGAHDSGSGRAARADLGERDRAGAAGGREHAAARCATATAPETHDVQYFEMIGNRGIYHQGWTAVTKHRTPWMADSRRRSTTTCGSCTGPTTGRRRMTWPQRIPRSSPSCSDSG